MSSKVPYRISEIDLNNICYTDIKSNNKKTIVYIKYMDNNKLKNIVFQTPTLLSTNTIQLKNDMYELDVPLIGKEKEKINKFINFLNLLDKKIIKDAKINNKWFELFSKIKTMKYQKVIRDNNNINGCIRLKLLKTNDFETLVQNNNNRIQFDDIQKDSWLKCILEIYAIWINENGFGLFIRPILLSFKPCMKISYNYKLLDESDENEIEEVVDTLQDNSIFIRSENEITSSVLELPTQNNSSVIQLESEDDTTMMDIEKPTHSSDEPVVNNDINSSTSSDN